MNSLKANKSITYWDNGQNEEESALQERVDTAIEMLKSFVMVGAAQTMTLFNGK